MDPHCHECQNVVTKVCIHPSCNSNPFLCGNRCRQGQNAALLLHTHNSRTELISYPNLKFRIDQVCNTHGAKLLNEVKKKIEIIKNSLDSMLKKLQQEVYKPESKFSREQNKILQMVQDGSFNNLSGRDLGDLLNSGTEKNQNIPFTQSLSILKKVQAEIGTFKFIDKKKSLELFSKGKNFQLKNSINQALAQYSQGYKCNTQNFDLTFRAGYCYQKLGHYEDSLKFYEKYLSIAPEDHVYLCDCYFNVGYIYGFHKHYHVQAVKYLNKAIHMNNRNDNYFNNRGICYFKLGNYEKALEDFSKAIQLKPLRKYFSNRGKCYAKDHMLQEAQKDFEKAGRMREQ